PAYLARTERAIAGDARAELVRRDAEARAAGKAPPPEPGALCYMLSKRGYLGDDAGGPWRPHVMFFLPRTDAAQWGANLPGSPIMADASDAMRVFFVVVSAWSDGTPAPPGM